MYAIYAKGNNNEFGSNNGNGLPWGSYPEELARFHWGLNNYSLKIKGMGKEIILVTTKNWYDSAPDKVLLNIEESAGTVKWVLVGKPAEEEYSLGGFDRHLRVCQVGKSLDSYLDSMGYIGVCIGGAQLLTKLYSLDLITEALVSIVHIHQPYSWDNYPHTHLTLPSNTLNSSTKVLLHKHRDTAENAKSFTQYKEIH